MMDSENKKRWLIKDDSGRVRGPFYTDDILARIARGEISGGEKIALYPSTNWIPISSDPQFYDFLLNALNNEKYDENWEDDETPPPNLDSDKKNVFSSGENEEENVRSIHLAKPPLGHRPLKDSTKTEQVNRVEVVSSARGKNSKDEEKKYEEIQNERKASKAQSQKKDNSEKNKSRNKQTRDKYDDQSVEPDIELFSAKKILKKKTTQKRLVPFLLIGVTLIGVLLYFYSSDDGAGDRLHLLAPRKGQPAASEEQTKARVQSALREYVQDNFSNYLRAQDALVSALEGNPKNLGALSLVCLTYLELWPYSYQDSQDLAAISTATQWASQVDPAGLETSTCRTVDLIVRGRLEEAKGSTEMVLDTFGRTGQPPVAFYYFKALLHKMTHEYDAAISYARSAQGLWPQWIRLYSLDAIANFEAKKYNEAANVFRNILKSIPKHKVSLIYLGVIEYLFLRNYQEGERLLQSAMQMKERAPQNVLAQGYLGLAEIAILQQNSSAALKYAKQAYSYNSTNSRVREIIVSIGGENDLISTRILDSQLVFEGDQLVREGDCNGAQAYYRAAYDLNKKNGLAAMKAAECLWSLSLSTDATQWLDRAIRADPKLMDAYVLLADYYSQRFNYGAAGKVLSQAKTQIPNSYKVYRGYALVEFRRNNYQSAINYSERAIQLYEADVESYIILAKSLMGSGSYSKAFESSKKAIEFDLNNREAQVVYAQALGAVRGLHVGIDYLVRLVNTYPTIVDYRISLGELYLKDQSYSLAEKTFRQIIRIMEKPKVAHILLAKTLERQRRFEEAKDAYFKAASLDPADVEPLFLAGQLFLQMNQPSEARQQFNRVLRVNKEYPLVNYYIGKAALMMGSESEALEQANIEKIKNPNLAEPYILAAEAYTEMKQFSNCAGEYQKAMKLWSGDANIYVKSARCFRLAGNIDAALSMINEGGTIESGNPEVWKEQGAIYEMRQDQAKAIEAYNQYLILAPNAEDRPVIESRINSLSR